MQKRDSVALRDSPAGGKDCEEISIGREVGEIPAHDLIGRPFESVFGS